MSVGVAPHDLDRFLHEVADRHLGMGSFQFTLEAPAGVAGGVEPGVSAYWLLPAAGIPPACLSIVAMCIRFQLMVSRVWLVNSFSGPPESGSR